MRLFWFFSMLFSLLGYLFSCFLIKIDTVFPLDPTSDDYLNMMTNSLSVPYALIGFCFGAFLYCVYRVVLKLIGRYKSSSVAD